MLNLLVILQIITSLYRCTTRITVSKIIIRNIKDKVKMIVKTLFLCSNFSMNFLQNRLELVT